MESYSDNEIINGILRQDRDILQYIYDHCLPMIERMVLTMNGSKADAADIFQEVMIIIINNINKENFRLYCKFSSYFYSIAKKLWFQELKSNHKRYKYDGYIPDLVEDSGESDEMERNLIQLLKDHFKTLSKDCQKILRMYLNNATNDRITKVMGYKNNHHTMDRKYRCKNSLKRRIYQDPKFKEIKNEFTRQNRSLY